MDKSRIQFEPAVEFISRFEEVFFQTAAYNLGTFIEDGFLKDLFQKNPSKTVDKAQLLIERFGETANPVNFSAQSQATNIQPTTLALIHSIALYVSSKSWENFQAHFFLKFGDMGDDVSDDYGDSSEDDLVTDAEVARRLSKEFRLQTPPKPVVVTPPILPDVDMIVDDHSVTPETSQKKDKQKARVTVDKQIKHQSTTAKPDAKTPVNNSQKEKNKPLPVPEATQILTGYEAVGDEQERIRDIIVYDIPYTWDLQKILAELKLWGNAIKCSVKRQHKYQTLRVKIALSSFALPQFNKYWTTDLGGIPVRWFPASWTLRERKQREKFQAVIHDIPEDMTMATLWTDRKPCNFLMMCGASSFKIIQTNYDPIHDTSYTMDSLGRHTAFKYQLFLDDLPTIEKFKCLRPDLYINSLLFRSCHLSQKITDAACDANMSAHGLVRALLTMISTHLLLRGILLLKEKEVKIDARNDNFESDTSTFNFGQGLQNFTLPALFMVSTMPNKAPGPSMISYEMLKYIGPLSDLWGI
ncbi:hypothetical protein RhiirA4_479506 [Rhizophagus irregularis]|uniref:Uncharacterized protein n=1 Tax=Rhizophagus irregularis TaxID=588596 RepID=A0A2I1HGJ9_9GLOM|nr:hypothetical protein RhiirA4_479506 [Rhizophagus irregularis]